MRGPFSAHSGCDNHCQQSAVLLSASVGAVPSLHSCTEGERCLSVDSMSEDSQIPIRRVQLYLCSEPELEKTTMPSTSAHWGGGQRCGSDIGCEPEPGISSM